MADFRWAGRALPCIGRADNLFRCHRRSAHSARSRRTPRAEIAVRLFISAKTVDHHVSAVLAKLHAPSRQAAASQAARLGLAGAPAAPGCSLAG
jgi:Bacterial regulatory proteins, luxR family